MTTRRGMVLISSKVAPRKNSQALRKTKVREHCFGQAVKLQMQKVTSSQDDKNERVSSLKSSNVLVRAKRCSFTSPTHVFLVHFGKQHFPVPGTLLLIFPHTLKRRLHVTSLSLRRKFA